MPRFPALAVAALIAACCTSSCASAESANSAAESFAPPTIWRLLGGGRGAAPPVATAIRRQLGGEPKIGDDCHRATVIDDCGVYGCDYKDFRERGEGSAACKKALGDRCGQFLSLGDQERYEINCERCMVDKEKELDAANCTSAAKNGFCNKDPDIGVCAVCTDDNMCRMATSGWLAPIFVCDKIGTGGDEDPHPEDDAAFSQCGHKRLKPFVALDVVTLVLVIVSVMAAASAGIGGGGLLVPIFLLVARFPASQAIPLSSATISGGAVANYFTYSRRWHPKFEQGVRRPLIEYELGLLLMPALLAGTMLGALLDKVLPEWLITVLLFVLLFYTSQRTLRKAFAQRAKERAAKAKAMATGADLLGGSPAVDLSHRAPPTCRDLFPPFALGMTVICWLFVFGIAMIKGGHGTKPALAVIKCDDDHPSGNAIYWFVQAFSLAALFAITVIVRGRLMKKLIDLGVLGPPASATIQAGLLTASPAGGPRPELEGEVAWTANTSLVYPVICLVCGMAAGLLGIGGGMVVGPLLLELKDGSSLGEYNEKAGKRDGLGLSPQSIAATSAYTVLITATTATVQFITLGLLELDYALMYSVVGLLGSFVGQKLVDAIIKKYDAASIIVFVIGGIIAVATVLLGWMSVKKLITDMQEDAPMGFRPLCGSGAGSGEGVAPGGSAAGYEEEWLTVYDQ